MRTKARLTITLAKDILRQIDRTVDGKLIRNRSHAIETILRESLLTKVSTAVILAGGGKSESAIPPLLTISQKPLIFILLDHLIAYGIKRVYLLAGQNRPYLEKLMSERDVQGASVYYADEKVPLGTAGAVKAIEAELDDEPFIVIHGDVLTNINLAQFIEFHKHENTLATIAVKPRDAERRYGKVLLQGNKITEFSDTNHSEGISIVNTGVYLLNPECLRLIDRGKPSSFEQDLFPKLIALNELSAFLFQGIWFDVSDPDSYRTAQLRWRNA